MNKFCSFIILNILLYRYDFRLSIWAVADFLTQKRESFNILQRDSNYNLSYGEFNSEVDRLRLFYLSNGTDILRESYVCFFQGKSYGKKVIRVVKAVHMFSSRPVFLVIGGNSTESEFETVTTQP